VGAASLEYAGILLVVAVVVASLVAVATPIGGAIRGKICDALSASCRDALADLRARDLDIPCVTNQTDRALGFNVSVEFVRVDRKDTDKISVDADGSASVTLSQGSGVGLEATQGGTTGGASSGLEARARIGGMGDLAYVYHFPTQYGGESAARAFLDDRRSGLNQAVDIVVPGAQTLREGANQVGNWTQDRADDVAGWFGGGPSAAETKAREAQQAAGSPDEIEVSLSLQGEAGVSGDAGVARAEVGLSGEIKGTAAVALHEDGPDKGSTSFAGSAKFALTGEATVGLPDDAGGLALPPLLNIGGEYGSKVSYQVQFDGDGNPVKLVLATETTTKGSLGVAPQLKQDGTSAGVKVRANEGHITLETSTLDLTVPENRAAFDEVFSTYGASAGGRQIRIADIRVDSLPTMIDSWHGLQSRLDADAYLAHYSYDASGDQFTGQGRTEVKAAGYGGGGEMTSDTRVLASATGRDNRDGGVEQTLATCGR
jgi:hypothetical protein